MKCSIRVSTGVVLLALWALCASSAMAQDPVKVAPEMYKVRLENARVRVLEVTGRAGQKAALHKHPGYVVYSLNDGKARFTDAKGASAESDMTAGTASWRDAETHASEAVSDIHVLLFELKGAPRASGGAHHAGGADPVTADPSHFKVLLDNARVRVLEFRAAPGEKVPMHSHPDYITYSFSGGSTTKFTYPKGKPTESTPKAGDVVWHKAETHAGEISGAESHVLLVELK
jgi:quercetin dioxygenase-like cupin family protein